MKNKTRLACRISALALLLAILIFSLASCYGTVDAKENIEANISSSLSHDTRDYDYVSLYLDDWGITNFDLYKFSYFENAVSSYYNYAEAPESILAHASDTAYYFIENYYDNINLKSQDEVTDALLHSYAATIGDPYCVYREPEIYEDYSTDMSGKFGGIGVVIEYSQAEGTLLVTEIIIDSPAEVAGIKVGDYIISVDGQGVEDVGYPYIVYAVRGEIGTEVEIGVLRDGHELYFTAVRAEIIDKTVDYSLGTDGYGYVRISGFKENTYEQFVEAVDYMEANGALGIIFDLRSNPGGYLTTVCDMLSYIVPNGQTIVSYQYKNQPMTEIVSSTDTHPETGIESDHALSLPVVVICNEYTASAGEIFTAAVRDYCDAKLLRATIVGTTTYKKGIMQNTYLHRDGSSLTMTIAYYNPPCGENYHGVGVTPDVIVELDENSSEDTQLVQALEELKKLMNANNN